MYIIDINDKNLIKKWDEYHDCFTCYYIIMLGISAGARIAEILLT